MEVIQAGGLHYAQLCRHTAQSIPNNVGTPIVWTATNFLNGMTVGAGGITVTRAGLYRAEFGGAISLNDAVTGLCYLTHAGNNVKTIRGAGSWSGGGILWSHTGSHVFQASVGDVITMGMYHLNSVATNTDTGADYRPTLTVTEIR